MINFLPSVIMLIKMCSYRYLNKLNWPILITRVSRVLITRVSSVLITRVSRVLITPVSRVLITRVSRVLIAPVSRVLITPVSRVLITRVSRDLHTGWYFNFSNISVNFIFCLLNFILLFLLGRWMIFHFSNFVQHLNYLIISY